ncbi:HEPN domain-containing protein [Lactiplantibacillus herbarum]|uniref:HEPN domain-containing protein n=1 Tax=Lactiplantibacillus herbarum TaxID=1670446 RepID=UPI00064FCAC6|nr:HEPN domain-containing protein [Lactiplantibacillus herbarum]
MSKGKDKNALSEERLRELLNQFIKSVENVSEENMAEAEAVYTTQGVLIKYSESLLIQVEDAVVKSSNIHYYDGVPLGRQIMKKVAEIKKESDKEADELRQEIVSGIVNLIFSPDREYQCVIPITGVKVKETVMIGPVTFRAKSTKESYLRELEAVCDINFDRSPSFRGDFATVTVKSGSQHSSAEFAGQIVSAILDAFQVMLGQISRPLGLYVGDFPLQRTTEKLAVTSGEGTIIYKQDRFPAELKLDNEMSDNQYLNLIGKIQTKIIDFEHPKLSNLERNIYNANKLFSIGIASDFGAVRFTNLMSGIESLLEQNKLDQSITTQVSENMAFLIGRSAEDRLEIFKNMKSLYGMRSVFAHGDSTYIPNDKLTQLVSYIRRLIAEIIKKFEILEESGIQNYVKEMKFGLRQ